MTSFFMRAGALALGGGWLESLAARVSWRGAALGFGLFLITFSLSLAETALILVKLPAAYFSASHKVEFFADRAPAVRVLGLIGKNLLGLLHLVIGVLMSLPGVPGQGILTILIGIMLLDIPGTRALEIKIVSRPKVLRTINRIRARLHKPPLELD